MKLLSKWNLDLLKSSENFTYVEERIELIQKAVEGINESVRILCEQPDQYIINEKVLVLLITCVDVLNDIEKFEQILDQDFCERIVEN